MKKYAFVFFILGFHHCLQSQAFDDLNALVSEVELNESIDSTLTLKQKDSILSYKKYLLDIVYYKNKIELFEEKADTFALTMVLENAIKIQFYHDKSRRLYRIYKPFYLSSLNKLINLYDDDLEKLKEIYIFSPYRRTANRILKLAILKHGGTWDRPEPSIGKRRNFDTSVFKSYPAGKE